MAYILNTHSGSFQGKMYVVKMVEGMNVEISGRFA